MNDEKRIQQFEQMAAEDPRDELAHFSLGKAYLDAGQSNKSAESFARVLDINPKMSKAYQLLGEAHDKNGHREAAIEIVTQGVTVADDQGDRMPRNAMVGMLREWGAPVPQLKEARQAPKPEASRDAPVTGFQCGRCGRPSGKLPKPPFKGSLGEKVFSHTCEVCWREWIGMGTMVINELGLVLSSPEGQDAYDQQMIEFLQLEQV